MATARVDSSPRPPAAPLVQANREPGVAWSVIRLGTVTSVIALATPRRRGSLRAQADEVLAGLRTTLQRQRDPQSVIVQTVYLRSAADQAACERLLAEAYGGQPPLTTFVHQPPCGGGALAIEAWSVGGGAVRVARPHPQVVLVAYDGLTWAFCGSITPRGSGGVYEQLQDGLQQITGLLAGATVGFERVVRTWFYLGDITGPAGPWERYMELNRARTDFYQQARIGRGRRPAYPASTGVGMTGTGLTMQCLALDTKRKDVFLLPLENPQQTPAWQYPPIYSPESPKFARAMAAVIGDYVTTWISGTASILDSETQHGGDARRQILQTIDNIERLIAPENFARHGLADGGSSPAILAHLHVYLKRAQDYPVCRALCEHRFGAVPVLYTVADVCRSPLLVEMEGIAFASCTATARP